MAAGVLLISGMYIFLYAALCAKMPKFHRLGDSVVPIFLVLCVVMIQGAISIQVHGEFDISRFWKSCLFLIVFLLGASFFGFLAQRISNVQFDYAVKLVFYTLLLLSVTVILRSSFSRGRIGPHVFLYSEPSHFALNFLPFLLYMAVIAKTRMKLPLVLLGFSVAILLQSLILIIGIGLVAFVVIPWRRLLLISPVMVFVVVFSGINLDYYSSRLDPSLSRSNLSAMVYASGFERAYLNFKETLGFGVGFQQFGIIGSRGETMEIVSKMAGGIDSNLLDGGTVASKFLGEFGVLGAVLLLIYIVYFVKMANRLCGISNNGIVVQDSRKILAMCCFVMFFIDLFVRGAGYFSSSGFIFMGSLMWILQSENCIEDHIWQVLSVKPKDMRSIACHHGAASSMFEST